MTFGEFTMKPIVHIHSATILGETLVGTIYRHPKLGEFPDGYEVQTSPIIKRDGNRFETKNTIYKVRSWVGKSE